MKTSNKIGIIAVAIYLIVPLLIVGSSWLKVKNLPYDIEQTMEQLSQTNITTVNLEGVELQDIVISPSNSNHGWMSLNRLPDMMKISGETLHITLKQPPLFHTYALEYMYISGLKYAILNGKKYEVKADIENHSVTNARLIPIEEDPQVE
jgi:hypothetical protein